MPYVYRYIDLEKEEVVYVGKVTTYYDTDILAKDGLLSRHSQHQRESWYKEIGDDNLMLQYIQLGSHTDADIYETWLISFYDTGQLVNKAKTNWGESNLDLYTCIFGRWRNFRQSSESNQNEIRKQVNWIVDGFIKATDACRYNVEGELKILCERVREIERDMRKAERMTRFISQDDYKRYKKEE